MTFDELYQSLLQKTLGKKGKPLTDYNPDHLDCLLNPEKYAPVIHHGDCSKCDNTHDCTAACLFDAISQKEDGSMFIDQSRCAGCAACIEACKQGKLTSSKDVLPAMKAVRESGKQSYALIAPAFLGQLGENITPGQLRSAFKALGFSGMVEVALFADILTLKEALEFDKNINDASDFQLTSCCCPIWIAMIRKIYGELMPHVPGSVSPMVACGRVIKMLYPDAVTVFIGPCLAKKSEAREPDIKDAIDYVLTFTEVRDIFEAAQLKPETFLESEKDHSSRAGRIYARAGGVSEAVEKTLSQIDPDKKIKLNAECADGVPACKAMIERIRSGESNANFFEGMGCIGGCVGGPKAILPKDKGASLVDAYGDTAVYKTSLENPYVIELLRRLGIETIEELLENSEIFTRNF